MANITEAIEYSKKNPNTAFATELRKRIESGQMNTELSSAGLTQYIPKSTVQPEIKPPEMNIIDRVKDIPSDVKETVTGLVDNAKKGQAKVADAIVAMQAGDQGKLSTIFQVAGSLASAGAGAVAETGKGVLKLFTTPEEEKTAADIAGKFGQKVIENPNVQSAIKWYGTLSPEEKRNVDAAGGIAEIVTTFVGVPAVSTAGKFGFKVADAGVNAAANAARAAGETITSATKGAASGITNTILDSGTSVRQVISDITGPSVSDATKVSLNPMEALKGTGQDIQVSVKGKLKKLSELTPEDKKVVQTETAQNLNEFTKQAELFKKDRSVEKGSPVEIVGNRTDAALEVADAQRKVIGQKMGEIEKKYVNTSLPIGDKVLKTFTDTIKYFDNPKFGVNDADAPIVQKLISDYDRLNADGATINDRLDFVRGWDDYLRDAKDAFGNFKENKTVNTKIQAAVKDLKAETVDEIATIDPEYKLLRQQYAEHLKLQEIGDMLLGKEGAYGDRIKGAATVKRAIQSNSDAGARQFLAKLKEITGYDAIKEGDIALTAMENVGDYQGLSLLNILNEGQGGLIKKVLEKTRDITVGNDAKRVEKYVKKGVEQGVKDIKSGNLKGMVNPGAMIEDLKSTSKSLIDKAKKYKSTEEFVKAQGTPIYRGEGGSNVAQGKALLAEGKHFASDAEYPKGFGTVTENLIKPNAKILDLGDSTFSEISQKLGIPERKYISPSELSKLAKEKGYDVLKYNGEYKSTGKQFTHFVDLTGDSTLSKSQLTDIWNEAKKYKSAEELKKNPIYKNFTADIIGNSKVGRSNLLNAKDASRYAWRAANDASVLIDNADLPDKTFRMIVGKERQEIIDSLNKNLELHSKEKVVAPYENKAKIKQVVDFAEETKSQLTDIWNKANKK